MKYAPGHLDYLSDLIETCGERELPSNGLMGSNLFDMIRSSRKFEETEW